MNLGSAWKPFPHLRYIEALSNWRHCTTGQLLGGRSFFDSFRRETVNISPHHSSPIPSVAPTCRPCACSKHRFVRVQCRRYTRAESLTVLIGKVSERCVANLFSILLICPCVRSRHCALSTQKTYKNCNQYLAKHF